MDPADPAGDDAKTEGRVPSWRRILDEIVRVIFTFVRFLGEALH